MSRGRSLETKPTSGTRVAGVAASSIFKCPFSPTSEAMERTSTSHLRVEKRSTVCFGHKMVSNLSTRYPSTCKLKLCTTIRNPFMPSEVMQKHMRGKERCPVQFLNNAAKASKQYERTKETRGLCHFRQSQGLQECSVTCLGVRSKQKADVCCTTGRSTQLTYQLWQRQKENE